MGWTPPPDNGINVPECKCRPLNSEGASTMKIKQIGLDLAKLVFQVHGVSTLTAALAAARTSRRRASCRCRLTGAQSPNRTSHPRTRARTLPAAPRWPDRSLLGRSRCDRTRASRASQDRVSRLRGSVRDTPNGSKPGPCCALRRPRGLPRTRAVGTSRGAGREVRAALTSGRLDSGNRCCGLLGQLRLSAPPRRYLRVRSENEL